MERRGRGSGWGAEVEREKSRWNPAQRLDYSHYTSGKQTSPQNNNYNNRQENTIQQELWGGSKMDARF